MIGAGIGGLALAIRLQSAGIATTIVEARDQPGGRAGVRRQDGYTFDTGPVAIADPAALAELWALAGDDMAADVTLLPVDPAYRCHWPDGVIFDLAGDEAFRAEIAKRAPADVAGYRKLLDHAASLRRSGLDQPFLDAAALLRAAPGLARHQAWRSVHSTVARFVGNEKLRQALSFGTLLAGGNPLTAGAAALRPGSEGEAWCVVGGTNRLIAALVALFERRGGTIRLGDAAVRVETLGDRVTAVETASGWRSDCTMLAANCDMVHACRDLLAGSAAAARAAAKFERKRQAPSLFVLHFGIKGSWPGIPHRTILFGERYEEALTDTFGHGLLAADFPLFLDHPSVTDASLAPPGCSTFRAFALVPHLGKFPEDWRRIAPIIERRVLDELERRLIPDIRERIVTGFSATPADFAGDFNAWLGSAFGPEPLPAEGAWFAARNRDAAIANLYFVGAGAHPGGGWPGALDSAHGAADQMLGRG